MIYLASPYTHEDKKIEQERFELTINCVANLLRKNILVYSPIVYAHQMVVNFDLDGGWKQWQEMSFDMIERCNEVWVLTLDGWDKSIGVIEEIKFASQAGKHVKYVKTKEIILVGTKEG